MTRIAGLVEEMKGGGSSLESSCSVQLPRAMVVPSFSL